MLKVGLVSLGCVKNLVDSEIILAMFDESGFALVNNPEQADIIVINTCGFIASSKEESIDTIFEMAKYNKKLIVTGCLVQRYYEQLKEALPEADLLVKLDDYPKLHKLIEGLIDNGDKIAPFNPLHRVISTESYSAYLRISEGCNNRCSFCAIPLIRGPFRSRPYEEVMQEAKILANQGVKELVIISQDTTRYGTDFDNGHNIVTLLKGLLELKEFVSFRLLYLYPDEISDELIYLVRDNPRIAAYFDIPLQHASNKILKRMGRRGTKEEMVTLISKIRKEIPHVILRSTYIVGFPGESEEDFQQLIDFTKEIKFNHLGVFKYSKEEDTPSYDFEQQIDEETMKKRYEEIMETQKKISYRNNCNLVGRVMDGIIIQADVASKTYRVRTYFNAPDDIDGHITLTSDKKLNTGDIVKIRIIAPFVYDLYSELIEDN
ncbi:MAG: 30S ribosomal protein S12 methylthiotransferase RimO [Bacilli bacterium]|jgi:ribosomal protein S12 methylthiotransferase|nr:30S ribosomal protein S12 methylthiotransferase RimO [Bacilli bacterium]